MRLVLPKEEPENGRDLLVTFFVYLVVNTGMVTGLLPVVGVPLPMVSYGGSSLLASMLAVGLLLNVSQHSN
jgi:rod shape determining protein RodA